MSEALVESQENAADASQQSATFVLPESIELGDLHRLTHAELIAKSKEFQVRWSLDRTRHQLILDLIKFFSSQQVPIFAEGILEVIQNQHGAMRWPHYNFRPCPEDVFISQGTIRNYDLRPGHSLRVKVKVGRERNEKLVSAEEIVSVEGLHPNEVEDIPNFDALTAVFPKERIHLESGKMDAITPRAVDLIAPLGKGQRGLIIAPPRVGKTIMLKEIARAIGASNPGLHLILLLVDERPEEVTDLKQAVKDAEIFSSTFDENAIRHTQIAELVNERAKRLVELGKDVVILIDSITRLARGYNNMQPGKGRIMSGGVDTKALIKPKKFFGSARKVEEGGSLTILATCLVDTGSRMDEVIFEEFKGTGNMEVTLDRTLAERRVFPAIHMLNSATRRDELLYHPDEYDRVQVLRKRLAAVPPMEAMELLVRNLRNTDNNAALLLAGLK